MIFTRALASPLPLLVVPAKESRKLILGSATEVWPPKQTRPVMLINTRVETLMKPMISDSHRASLLLRMRTMEQVRYMYIYLARGTQKLTDNGERVASHGDAFHLPVRTLPISHPEDVLSKHCTFVVNSCPAQMSNKERLTNSIATAE